MLELKNVFQHQTFMKFLLRKMNYMKLKKIRKKYSNFISTQIEWISLNKVEAKFK